MMLSDREAEPVAMRFSGLGYQTFVLKYSVLNGGKNTWPEVKDEMPERRPEREFPAPILELGRAMLLIRSHAEEWNVDADQIGITGYSAGGHNCTMYASCWNRPFVTEALGVSAEQLKPAFCIAGYPFVSWELQLSAPMDPMTAKSYRWMYFDYFGTPDPTPEQMREASSDCAVSEDTCPMFLWNTRTDRSVDPRHSLRLALALADHGVDYEYHIFGEGQHGLSLADKSTMHTAADCNDAVAQWFPLAVKWLEKRVRIAPAG